MKTDELIGLLATGAEPVDARIGARRYSIATALGLSGATILMATLLRVRPDLAEAALLPMFWLKILFVVGLMLAGLVATTRLSRPGMKLGGVPVAIGLLMLAMWLLAAFALIGAAPTERPALFFGTTWKSCPLLIAMLSVPMFVATVWAMKGLAPTRPRLAGFAAGFFSGAAAALVYCLHCPELDAPFIAFWYVLGILIPAVVGSLLGNSLLRW
jgi:hypothetical protein